jgi:hypothetical protein
VGVSAYGRIGVSAWLVWLKPVAVGFYLFRKGWLFSNREF